MRTLGRALVAATWLLVVTAGAAEGQVFLASQSHPQFAIGPLFVVAGVRPDLGPVTVTISWSLTTPPGQRAVDINQDLFLLWPHEVVEGTAPGPADPALTRELEERGFAVSANGRLQLGTRDQMQMGTGVPVTPVPEVASFATYSRRAGPAAQLGSSTLEDPVDAEARRSARRRRAHVHLAPAHHAQAGDVVRGGVLGPALGARGRLR
jgi:hypothetical protein